MINVYAVKTYCKDDISLIENYEKAVADKENTWQCHHRREITTSRKDLIEKNEYFKRPASELIFLTPFEHNSLHASLKFKGNKNMLGKHHSEETKKKLALASKGNKNMLGKHHSEYAKIKMSEAHKGRTPTWLVGKHLAEEHKQKLSIANKGKTSWNKGKHHSEESRKKMSIARKGNKYRLGKPCSEETKRKLSEVFKGKKLKPFTEEHKLKISIAKKGMKLSEEAKHKMSEAIKHLHWFNNGIISVRAKSCPEGFVKGRIKRKTQIAQ